jgi:hypothetical protein
MAEESFKTCRNDDMEEEERFKTRQKDDRHNVGKRKMVGI